ncbi:MAG TPA: calcium/sodium antiporter [Gammaproteobacteria bacterium]|nr:calcium/sodium antiporter [Gammaproteobacteria bacterium]
MMPLWIIAIIAGLACLVWGSDRFVLGASVTASNLGVPPLIVGLTVIGVGTSAPEIFVSTTAALGGNPGVAVGNSVGSNIANIGLVAGVCALVVPVNVKSGVLRREFPLMFVVIALAWFVLYDRILGFTDGLLLLASFAALLGVIVRSAGKARRSDPLTRELKQHIPADMATRVAVAWLLVGLVVLLVGSRLIVWGAVGLARAMDVSDLVIGLTIVAVGTSLPELAASVASVLKSEPDLALGNVLGSNMFNLLPVLAAPGLIAPGPVPAEVLSRDMPVMMFMSVALFLMASGYRRPGRVNRLEGAVLLAAFAGYQGMFLLSAGI